MKFSYPYQYMLRIKNTLALTLLLALSACASQQKVPPSLLNALREEQTSSYIVIGYKSGHDLEYIDTTAGNTFRRVSIPPETHGISLDLKSSAATLVSSDGEWIGSCSKELNCTIKRKSNPQEAFSVSSKNALTPLYWAPNNDFAFLVQVAPKWRFPIRCSLEDEWDVTVYDIAAHSSGVLTTVCGGFPYGSLRWYKLK